MRDADREIGRLRNHGFIGLPPGGDGLGAEARALSSATPATITRPAPRRSDAAHAAAAASIAATPLFMSREPRP